jgi:hypothetical protein
MVSYLVVGKEQIYAQNPLPPHISARIIDLSPHSIY